MSVLRDLQIVRCNLYRQSALFTLLARWCFVASRITNEPAACILPQQSLYVPHIAAVAASFSRLRSNRSDGGAIAAVAVSFSR